MVTDNIREEIASSAGLSPLTHSVYLFGPVPSRRLGLSLGVDILPRKTCTLDCVYCELGETDRRALRRMEYVPTEAVIEELRTLLPTYSNVDVITFSGSGEPTLHSGLAQMISAVKEMTNIPVAVITNGTLLFREDVRNDLLQADIVLPSLDAATLETFRRVNRPHPHLNPDEIIEGLVQFRKQYKGHLYLEILLVKGMNDSREELFSLRDAVRRIKPDRLQLNTVVRPPALPSAEPVEPDALEAIRTFFGDSCEIISSAHKEPHEGMEQLNNARVLAILRRRAMTLHELGLAIDAPLSAIQQSLHILKELEMIRAFEFQEKKYFEAVEITHG